MGKEAIAKAGKADAMRSPKAHPHADDMKKIPRAFHSSHAFWRGFWYCKSARGKSPMDAERAASGFKWNWYMHHHRTTPMCVPSWLFDHHKHSSLNSMHGNRDSGSRACGWGWGARHDDIAFVKTSAHGANNYYGQKENARALGGGSAAGAQNDNGPGFAFGIPDPHFAAGSAHGHQKNAHGGDQSAGRSFDAGSPSRENVGSGSERCTSGLNAQSAPALGASSRNEGADGPGSSHRGRHASKMASDFQNPASFIFVIGGTGGNDAAQRSRCDGNGNGATGYPVLIGWDGASAAFAHGAGSASASGSKKTRPVILSGALHDHAAANRSDPIGDAGNAAPGNQVASGSDGRSFHDQIGSVGMTTHGRSGIAPGRFRLIKGSSLISKGFVRKVVHLKVAQDSVNPE